MARAEESEDYRPVSGMAVAAAVLGVLSSMALFSPVFSVLSLLGIVLAVVALREFARPECLKVGRLAALAGLALSIGFLAQGVTSQAVGRWLKERRVERVAAAFVEAIREDRTQDAVGMLSKLLSQPQTSAEEGQAAADPVELFRGAPLAAVIRNCGGRATAHVDCTGYREESQEDKDGWLVTARLSPCEDGRDVVIALEVRSAYQPGTQGFVERWEITKVEIIDASQAR
mgnify:FL=1